MLTRRAAPAIRFQLMGSTVGSSPAGPGLAVRDGATSLPPPQAPQAPAETAAPTRRLSGEGRSGTILCGVTDSDGVEAVVDVAVELSERLGLRLVLVAVGEGILDSDGDPLESVTTNAAREGARKALQRVVQRSAPPEGVECRLEVGDLTVELARVAQEERADLLLIGAPRSRLLRGRVHIAGLDELRMAAPCPVVVVPSRPV